jgi:large subunit ribosomal protein L5
MDNPMKDLKIEKITLNIGAGDDKQKVEKAVKLLEMLTEKKAVITNSKKRSTFGVAKGKPLGAMVTLRKKDAEEFLKKAFVAKENKISQNQIDSSGNFSFGIKEYIDLPGVRYSHDIGMSGFDVSVTLERKGFRIKRRRIKKTKIPEKQKISKEETAEWLKSKFGVETI